MKKIFSLLLMINLLFLQGCGLQKIIQDAISKFKAIHTVSGTIALPNANDYSGTEINFNGKKTKTDSNGRFTLPVSSSLAQSINELTITHPGFITENVTVPAENESGEYFISKQLEHIIKVVTINVVCNLKTRTKGEFISELTYEKTIVEEEKDMSQTYELITSNNIEYVFVLPTNYIESINYYTYIMYFSDNVLPQHTRNVVDNRFYFLAQSYFHCNNGLIYEKSLQDSIRIRFPQSTNEPKTFSIWFVGGQGKTISLVTIAPGLDLSKTKPDSE